MRHTEKVFQELTLHREIVWISTKIYTYLELRLNRIPIFFSHPSASVLLENVMTFHKEILIWPLLGIEGGKVLAL